MHDKPAPQKGPTSETTVPVTSLIADLADADPAEAPDLADEIAGRLEAELGGTPGRPGPAEPRVSPAPGIG